MKRKNVCGDGFAAYMPVLAVWMVAWSAMGDAVVADYRDDFLGGSPPATGWHYLWNAPSGWLAGMDEGDDGSSPVGDPSGYTDLLDAGTMWTADGNTSGADSQPDAYMKLASTYVHPPRHADGAGEEDRYAIAAYMVAESGYYALSDTLLQRTSASQGAVEILGHVGTAPPFLRAETYGTAALDFDTQVGYVAAGETIYIAIGPGESAASDYALLDFSIVKKSAETVAGYQDDFTASAPLTTGWEYLWNAPVGWTAGGAGGDETSGWIGVPAHYAPLADAGSIWTADGDSDGSNSSPDSWIRLSASGGHPGRHASASGNTRDRYAIAAYTVQANGFYFIANSFLGKASSSGDGVEVLVFPGVSGAVLRRTAPPGGSIGFDSDIGYLAAGQTIYVAVGAGATATSDAFVMDYDICRIEGEDIQAQIEAAAGAPVIRVAPGRYYSAAASRHIDLNQLTDCMIAADGVQLVCQTVTRAVDLEACENVALCGLTITYDPSSHLQGTVESIDANAMTLRIHEGYPLPDINAVATSGIACEPFGNHAYVTNAWTRYNSSVQQVEPDLFRYVFTHPYSSGDVAAGQYMTLNSDRSIIGHAVYVEDSYAMTLRDIRLHGGPMFGVLFYNSGDIVVDHVQITPGDKPLLASVPPLRSCNADGIHITAGYDGITISNSKIVSNGDDSIVLTSPYAAILNRPQPNVVTVIYKLADDAFVEGESLRLYAQATASATDRLVTGIALSPMTFTEVQNAYNLYFPDAYPSYNATAYELTLDSPATGISAGDLCVSLDRSNAGFLVENCEIRNTRARGILAKGSYGVVSNNVIDTTWLAGIQFRPEPVHWLEADYSHNVQVVANQLNRCGIGQGASGSVCVDSEDEAWGANGHSDLLFENNTVSNAPGCSFYLAHASDVILRDNVICNSHEWMISSEEWNRSAVWLEEVDTLSFSGVNKVVDPGAGADTGNLVGYGENVSNISGSLILQ